MNPPKTNEYYSPQPTAPPVVTGIPVSSMGDIYPATPTAPTAFQTQAQGPVTWSTAPTAFQTRAPGPVTWSTGLCDCGDDVGNCCITCLIPCITFGQVAEIVDRGSTSCGTSGALYTLILCFTGWQCLYSCLYRSKMRAQYSLPESPCPDCLVHWCCEPCALCQEYRELKHRGFDMNIGWHANMERRGHGATMPPTMQVGMSR